MGRQLGGLLSGSAVVRLKQIPADRREQAKAKVAEDTLAALLVIPPDYSEHLLERDGEIPILVTDPAQPAGRSASTVVETAAERLEGAVQAARLSVSERRKRVEFASEGQRNVYFREGIRLALTSWQDPPVAARLSPLRSGTSSRSEGKLTGFIQASSGMLIQFAVFGLITAAMILVLERKSGALQRLRMAPLSPAAIIGGHLLAMFTVIFLQQLILIAVGQFAFGVEYLRAPGATVLMAAGLAAWAASVGLLISAISRREEQVVVFSLIAMFVFSAMGGAWFPLEVAGDAFATIGHIMPTAWAIRGYQNVVLRGLGFESVLVPAGLLLAYAAGFFTLAVWRFRFE
jgi:ABC-2 type transport system permease protein